MRFLATITIAALALAAPAAHAQTFYSSLTAYNAAATTATVYNFNGIAPAGGFGAFPILTTPAPGRVTFSYIGDAGGNPLAVSSTFASGDYTLSDGTDSVRAGNTSFTPSTITIALGGAYTGFAIDYGMSFTSTNSYTFTLFNDSTQVGAPFVRTTIGGDNFLGVTSASAFNNVRVVAGVTGTGDNVVFDNARVGSAGVAVVPEAGTLALIFPALAMIGAVVVRRKR